MSLRRLALLFFLAALFSIPLVFAQTTCNSSDPCSCLCGVPYERVDPACAGEVFGRGANGSDGPSPNVLDAEKGGCSVDWCVPDQQGKRCTVTSNYFGAAHSNISIVDDSQQPSLCTGQAKPHKPWQNCSAKAAASTASPSPFPVPGQQGSQFKPPSGQASPTPFPPNENQSFYDRAHEFVYGYPATKVNITNITRLVVFPAGVEMPEEHDSNFVIGEMVNVGYGIAESTNKLATIRCSGSSLCECKFSANFSEGRTVFQCSFFPFVNGTYQLYVRDVLGNDNSKFIHSVRLVPNKYAELVYSPPQDRLALVLLGLVLLAMLAYALAYYASRLRSRQTVLEKLSAKKAMVENDLKTIQYRFMKREITQDEYLQQYGAKQAELSQVESRIKEGEQKDEVKRRKYQS